MWKIDNRSTFCDYKVRRTWHFCWPFVIRSAYRVLCETRSNRWYRRREPGHKFFSAILENSNHCVTVSEHSCCEDSGRVAHMVLVDGLPSWVLESYDRTIWSAPSYRVLDLEGIEILGFPRTNWRRYNFFGHVLTSKANDRGEICIFEHGGVDGRGWPAELMIGLDLFKEFFESI